MLYLIDTLNVFFFADFTPERRISSALFFIRLSFCDAQNSVGERAPSSPTTRSSHQHILCRIAQQQATMAVPELKAKKVARAATQAKAAVAAAKQSASDAAAFTKAISARAAAYEAEYAKVSYLA